MLCSTAIRRFQAGLKSKIVQAPANRDFAVIRSNLQQRRLINSGKILQQRRFFCDNPAVVRLNKLMASQGLCSRREADDFIRRGWVLVDGECVSEMGRKVDPRAKIEITGRRRQLTIMLNKPAGYVSAQAEHGHIPAIDLLTPENQWQERGHGKVSKVDPLWEKKLAVIGRLDINSTGLLLFSQDGVLARRVIGADSEVEKEYVVGVREPDSGLERKLS